MSLWKKLWGKSGQPVPGSEPVPRPGGVLDTDDPLSRMQQELAKASGSNSIDGVIIDAYPGHEMSCPVHGQGGVDLFTGQKKHQFKITGDRVVCTLCGATAVNPSKGNMPWTGVANNVNLQLIIAHRQEILKAFGKPPT